MPEPFCDVYVPFPKFIWGVDIHITEIGAKPYLEFLGETLGNTTETLIEGDNKVRGVFGYVSWGSRNQISGETVFTDPYYINWEHTSFIVPKSDSLINVVRLWFRNNVRAHWELRKGLVEMSVGLPILINRP